MKRCLMTMAIVWLGAVASAWTLHAGERNSLPKENVAADKNRLVIHEWGTFTSLLDEAGQPISGVNTDDEPVPEFVHRISELIRRPTQLAPVYDKGVPRSHRQVRMRLETPVVYFYPPEGQRHPLQVSLKIGFQGGWLTEYYPTAQVSAPGLDKGNFRFGGLTPNTLGTLEWNDLTIYPIGSKGGKFPETNAPVWLAPREVNSANLKVPGGEAEKYLFYRGVGNLPSPITAARSAENDALIIRENVPAQLGLRAPLAIRAMWLVHVREDGSVAFRSLGAAKLTGEPGRELVRTPVEFAGARVAKDSKDSAGPKSKGQAESLIGNYSQTLMALRIEMRRELIADGLYGDEATAMLKTWELAYFKSPGLRVFYLLPQQWTDAVLPMQCSMLAEISRTMVGRIELVTPRQRDLLKEIGTGKVSETNWLHKALERYPERNHSFARLWEGEMRFDDLAISIPPDYRAYIDLGRFRNALILDELARFPASGIDRFAEAYQIQYYVPDDDKAQTATARVK